MTSNTTVPPIGATILGYPRIGRNRELKRALESSWAGRADQDALRQVAADVREDARRAQRAAGLDTLPANTFSFYDQMLDTSLMLGVVPERFRTIQGGLGRDGTPLRRYFAMARGTDEVAPLEMTKWFDTNYHYLVPEIGATTSFVLDPAKPVADLAEHHPQVSSARPVVVGPWTYLSLAKASAEAPTGFTPLDRLDDLVRTYAELLGHLARAGAAWVQLDEPALVRDLSPAQVERVHDLYATLAAVSERPAILVATYFGTPVEALPALAATDVDGIGLDLTRGVTAASLADVHGLRTKDLVLGAVDGRNIWRADLEAVHQELQEWRGLGRRLSVATSCSLLHVPYDVSIEDGIDDALRANLAFADQKLAEVVALQRALDGDQEAAAEAFAASAEAIARRGSIRGRVEPETAARAAAVVPTDR
ncbi:MAG: 5-methyltetrahydropteroyltriglutamate--homocysteine S-methyltransferase, partial [Nocardioides sp.]